MARSFGRFFMVFLAAHAVSTRLARSASDPHAHMADSAFHHLSRGPIGVVGDHTHAHGAYMLSLRYNYMGMDGMRSGSDRLSTDDVLASYPVAPTSMDAQMFVLGGMYAPVDHTTLMLAVPYVAKEMDHATRNGGTFSTRADGIGDLKFMWLFSVGSGPNYEVHFNMGLSAPTGSTSEKDDTPTGKVTLPYRMQPGSGTWDLIPGITYAGMDENWSWGAQALAVLRPGRNDDGYTLGRRFEGTAWGTYHWVPGFGTSIRADLQDWAGVDGQNPDLDPTVSPAADPDLQGGSRLDLLVGVEMAPGQGGLQDHRIAIEVGFPVWQDLDGPQLETDLVVYAGWQHLW